MPELPEVETVRRVLKTWTINKTIVKTEMFYDKVLEGITYKDFNSKIVNQKIHDINRIGKYLLFVLDDYILLSHLRMEGKYYLVNGEVTDEKMNKHKIIAFYNKIVYND